MELNVASWNIYIFGDKNAEGIAKTIEENQIDVIGIQEAGIYFDEDEKYDIVKEIAEKVGYHYEFVNALDFRKVDSDREHKMGNAIISRFPIENLESFSLNPESIEYDGNPEKEPRIAIKCEFDIEGRKIVFITTHLQYTNEFEASDIRKAEIKKLLKIIRKQEQPVVLAGDFNSKKQNAERQVLEEELKSLDDDSSTWTVIPFDYNGWQVEGLEYRVDEIYYSEQFEEMESFTIDSEISDHLPVKARLKLD